MGTNFNYSGLGLKANSNSNPVQPTIFLKSEFDNTDDVGTKDDTGYIGAVSTKLGVTRTSASGEVTLKDSLRWKEGLELFFFAMFGGNMEGIPSTETNEEGLFVYNFGDSENLPYVTIIQGYNALDGTLKPVIYDNAIINSLKLSLGDDGDITVEIGFLNDYPMYNIVSADPTRVYAPVSKIVSKANVKIGIGDVGSDDEDLTMTDCIKSMDIEFNWNSENTNCYSGQFGKNNLGRGDLSSDVNYTMNLNKNNILLETKFATGKADGHYVKEEVFEQRVVLFIDGYKVGTDSKTSLRLEIPIIALKPPKRNKSGDEDTIEVESNAQIELATGKMVNGRIASELEELLISTQTYELPIE